MKTLPAESSGPKSLRERIAGGALAIAAFMVSYILTAGPASVLVRSLDAPFVNSIAHKLYLPVILLVKLRIPGVSAAIQWYVDLFR
jgi:hypothetical protein